MSRGIIHRKKFADGRKTPQQVHREMTYAGKRCTSCKGPPAIRICVFYPVEEIDPAVIRMLRLTARAKDEPSPFIRFNEHYGNKLFLMVSDVYACETCRKAAEVTAAHGPSYAVVHVDRGPAEKATVVLGWSPGGALV